MDKLPFFKIAKKTCGKTPGLCSGVFTVSEDFNKNNERIIGIYFIQAVCFFINKYKKIDSKTDSGLNRLIISSLSGF